MGRHVVLVGMMGSGKTTVGSMLASALGRRFIDSDEQVEAATGRTVREIFESDGEEAFRALEAGALSEALAHPEPAVIAAAGGVVLDGANRESLRRAGTVVWLKADAEVLADRVDEGDHRPLLVGEAADVLSRLEAERRHLYAEVADEIVDVSQRAPEEVVTAVLERLG